MIPPLDAPTGAALRLLVFDLRRSTRARVFAPVVHVGIPGGDVYTGPGDLPDHSLRTDLVLTLLAMHDEDATPTVWLTRVGHPTPHDRDVAWLAAARAGFAESGQPLAWFAVITKNGWLRPATGEARAWQRLRLRGAARPPA